MAGRETRRLKYGVTMAVVGAAALATAACIIFTPTLIGNPSAQAKDAKPVAAAAPPEVPVEVAEVVAQELPGWKEFSGRLEAVETVDLRSRVAGQVLAVHFREGSLVTAGDLLVTIDPDTYAAEVAHAEADLAAASARLSFTKKEHERAEKLVGTNTLTVREGDTRANAYREAQAQYKAAQAALTRARLDLRYTEVRAPISGRVGRIQVNVGNLVAAGASTPALTTLVSVDPIYASFDADEQVVLQAIRDLNAAPGAGRDVSRIPVEMEAAFTGGNAIGGRLQLIDNIVNADTGTVRVRAQFDNPDGLLIPGQFAKLRMGRAANERSLLITERAVGVDQGKKFVLVVGEDDRLGYREVTLGRSVGRLRVVTTGLSAGERIVVNGLQRVRPGMRVMPEDVAMIPQVPVQTAAN